MSLTRSGHDHVVLPVDEAPRRRRIADRWANTPARTLPMAEADIPDGWAHFEEPDAAELGGGGVTGPPPGWADWREGAADRWPSFM
ncbi:hypothetical protein ABZ743_09285 [Streptomyces sp. NPDC006662]|uniref:hypothetical protein n=1 Tax=Streptomyces sp. NPDC006662 TaxID=3156902 RepID=UPI00340AD815